MMIEDNTGNHRGTWYSSKSNAVDGFCEIADSTTA